MKAVRYHKHGGPETLVYEDVPEPSPGPGEMLLRVKAVSLNRLDTRLRAGAWPPPHIPGCDIAGDVAALGPGVTSPKVGDRVLLFPGVSCGKCEACNSGQQNWCLSHKVIGWQLEGGYAQYVVAPAINARPIPPGITYVKAATLPICLSTAWHALFTRGGLRPGETVFIAGGSSGVGVFAIQLAKLSGAIVIATTSTEEKVEKAKELGADHVVNYRKEDPVVRVRELTQGRAVDLAIDHAGQDTWEQGLSLLRKGGRIVSVGATSGARFSVDIGHIYRSEISILGTYAYTPGEFDLALRLVSLGKVKPVVDLVFPLEEAAEAHRRIEKGLHFGKVVLEVS
ncbi:MAG: zinc-binding dehydrogenase [Chloroflexi bacterium]|nr:zinc-binding dehydrogenase [Chloroflexota bacterium]